MNLMNAFKKKDENDVPDVSSMLNNGMSQQDIIDSIQNTMVGKTEEYNKTISDVNVELQAFEKVIDRLIPAISDSIKELRDLIDDLKTQKTA